MRVWQTWGLAIPVGCAAMSDFSGKTAVVTGAASGIGRATAKALADAGATVTLLDVNDELGASAAEAAGGTYVHLDVSRPDEWRALFASFDRLDLLHLNAGIYDTALADITSISDARYRAYLGVNVDGVFFGLREAIPLLEQTQGSVVVTSSMAGIMPLPANPLYALTKWSLIGLVRSIHGELERRGIRINALCPGAVATPLMGDDPHGWFQEKGIVAFEPEVLAATVVDLLASDRSGEAVLHRPPWPPEAFEFARLPEH
jgi:NAD(P)-dependent dehydrogenase (short-subunit alcohol dehydrogenase family)